MGIPGEDLAGSTSATAFVAWYNGHPDYRHLEFDLSCKRAVIVGNGNVAMDVARMLALTPAELARTDVADHALEILRSSAVEEIVILGRRGPAQAAFTNPELLELGEMVDADVVVDPRDVVLDEHSAASINGEGELTARRNVEILKRYSSTNPSGKPRRILLRFLVSPAAIIGSGQVEAVEIVANEIHRDASGVLNQQEGCPGDGRPAARGPGRRRSAGAGRSGRRVGRRARSRAQTGSRHLRRLAVDRPRRAQGRRVRGPPAGQALQLRGAADRGPADEQPRLIAPSLGLQAG
jgi:hypothetical protein